MRSQYKIWIKLGNSLKGKSESASLWRDSQLVIPSRLAKIRAKPGINEI